MYIIDNNQIYATTISQRRRYPILTSEREKEIREWDGDVFSKELLSEIGRLREERDGLYAELLGQEYRLGSQIENLTRNINAAFEATRAALDVNSKLREKLAMAERALEIYANSSHWKECNTIIEYEESVVTYLDYADKPTYPAILALQKIRGSTCES